MDELRNERNKGMKREERKNEKDKLKNEMK